MQNIIFRFLFLFIFFSSYSQNQTLTAPFVEDENGKRLTDIEEKRIFFTKLHLKRAFENKQLLEAQANQTAVEMCTNGGFEQHETISGASKLKNFLYTIGDPPGPTECRSITNTANSYIDIYNPSSTSVMATTVPANLIDPYIGNINAFDQYALKINYANSSTYGSIVQGKRFKTNNENFLKFNFKAVLMTVYDTGHTDNQPFVKARILNASGVVVNEFCLVGDESNCIFTKIPGSDAAILYTANWQSGLLDISSIPNNEEFTVEFMASRCGFGGHFGYMYVDDVCLLHSNENLQGSIELDPLNKVCSTLPINVCGKYTIPNSGGISATLGTITLNLYNSAGTSIYTTTTTSSLNTTTREFCFSLNASNFPNTINANYNVGVTISYNFSGSTTCAGTVFNNANDPDANPGWDISFQNCSPTCNFSISTTKLSLCDSNHDGSENFNLTSANGNLVTSVSGFTFSYFTSYADAASNSNAITNITAYNSTSKTIYVRVTESSTCYKIIPIQLEVKNPNVNITGILNVCSGSTVLTATQGSSYLWSTGAITQSISVTTIGTYSVTVTDINGCVNSATVTIEPSQIATTPNVNITQPSCFVSTGTIQVTSVAAEYSFDNGSTWTTNSSISNLNPGTYYIKTKTINNCISYPLEIKINAALTSYPNSTYVNPAYCGAFGSITITTQASFYSFDDGATWTTNPIANNLSAGTYKIRTKDAQGCISNFNTVLLSNISLENPIYTIINPACGVNGSITINTLSDFYTFDGGTTWVTSNILTNLTTGSYAIAIKNNLGCTSNYSNAYVYDLEDISPEISYVEPICGTGGSISINTVAAFYSFDDGVTWVSNNIATNLNPGTYKIKVKTLTGCISDVNYVYLYPPTIDSPIIQVIQPQCGINGSITINTLSDFYSFDGGTTWVTNNFMSLAPGNYSILIKNNLGCISQTNYINLYAPLLPEPNYTVVQPGCSNTGSITITTSAAFYSIDNGTTWVTSPIFNNLIGGSYYVKIKNSIGCESNNGYVNLNTNYIANPTYTYTNPYCGIVGSITVTSTANFFSIDGGVTWSSNPTFTNLASGYYYLVVKNNAGCESSSLYIYLSSNNLSSPQATIVSPCNTNNGSITITTAAAFYSINNGTTWFTSPVFSNLSSGYYYIKIKNSTNCESDLNSVYLGSELPSPTFTYTQPVCGVNGSITITTTSSFYSIDNGNTWVTNPVFTNLPYGSYAIRIKNSAGCISSYSYINLQQPYLPDANFTFSQPTCGTGGSITITTVASQYSIDGGYTWQTSPNFTNLTAGSYTVKIKNNLGCVSYGDYITLSTFYLPNPNITIVQPTCGNNGSITIATAAAQYSFDNGSTWTTNPVLSNLTNGYYYIVIKNSLGCISTPYGMNVNIHEYYLQRPLVTATQPTCSNGGNITILTSSDFYSFDNGTTWTTNPVLSNPTPGYYNIKIKNNLGCVSEYVYVYINSFYIPSPNITTVQPTCSIPTGSITINSPASEYSFDNGVTWSTNATLSNLASGSYNVKIKNSLGCVSSGSYTYIYSPPNLSAAPSVNATQPSSCGTTDGSITITSSASEYSFNDGVTWTTNPTKINLAAGTYYIKTRSNTTSCPSLTTIVNLNSGTTIAAPTFTVNNPGCSSIYGSISITTSASYYSFDNGVTYITSNTKTNLVPGIYYMKIKNAAGCISASTSATIVTTANLPSPNYTLIQPDCTNPTGSITITSPAAFYSFDNGATYSTVNNQNGLSPGTYSIKVKDASGCESNVNSVVINSVPNVPTAPNVNVIHPTNCTTLTGSITVTSSAALYSFDNGINWSTNNTSAPLLSGTYQVVIKNSATGCISPATIAIINAPPNAPALPTFTTNQPISCVNPFGTITITNTAYAYSFDNGFTYSSNPTSGLLSVGTYLIKVKNSSNCESSSVSVTINAPTDYPLAPLFTISQPDCNTTNGSISITTLASEYSFDNGVTWSTNPTLTNIPPGNYRIKIKNTLGCISSDAIAVIIPFTNFTSLPTLTSPQLFCIQQNATINSIAITGQNIKWYDALTNGNLLSNSTTLVNGATYYASQTINGCESKRASVLVNIQNTPAPTGNTNQSFCTSQNATLLNIVVSGTNVVWFNSPTSSSPLANTTLLTNNTTYYTTQNINGCESVNRLAVTINLINTLNATNYSEIICDDLNNNVEIKNLTNYNTYLISSTGNTFSYYNNYNDAVNSIGNITNFTTYNLALGTNTFYVRIDSPNTCFQIVTLTLELVSKPIIPINDIAPICEGSFITLDGGNNYDSYTWSTGETTQNITITQPGSYSVIVTENHGTTTCSSTKNFNVVNSNVATIQEIISSDWTDNNNTITVLLQNNSQGDYEYSLDGIDFQNNNIFSNLEAGEYTVFVRDKNGCGIVSEDLYLLTYPKFFTPNGDGYNEYWKIKLSENEPNLTIKIFDRYGKLLKQLGSNSIGWDGTYLGNNVPSSDYWFVVTRENGKEYKGHFSLKR